MTELEIINGNDEICKLMQFKSNKAYVYQVPNLFPHEKDNDTGWIELNVQTIQFHTDWNMLIGAYNRALVILNNAPETARQLLKEDKNFIVNFGAQNFFGVFEGQLHISSCWIKLVDFAKWWNSVSVMFKK
jgi:hypothetical protein